MVSSINAGEESSRFAQEGGKVSTLSNQAISTLCERRRLRLASLTKMATAEDGSGELLMPSYYQCTVEVYTTAVDQYQHLHTNYSHVQDLIRNISYYSKVSSYDIFWAICLATVLTLVRYILTATLFTVSGSE